MVRTILLLLLGFVILPFVAWQIDTPLTSIQWSMLGTAATGTAVAALLCFVVSQLTGNYSQVDKLWSLMPIGYAWYFAWAVDFSERQVVMAVLVTIWGVRLTYNFWRKGGYHWLPWKGEEDYRWKVLRQHPALEGKLRWTLFNFFFISIYQQGLILLFTLPALKAAVVPSPALGWLDGMAAGLMLLFILLETVADQQQYRFQTTKYRLKAEGRKLETPYADGFCRAGLWRWVRHPNYAAEQAIWLSFYLFSVSATGSWLNGSLLGAVLLLLLFQGSADFSEGISAQKYPAYREYMDNVGRFLPRIS
ncbi:MAG: hypothetical protein RLY31_2879 [Bacteroidota bacterium]